MNRRWMLALMGASSLALAPVSAAQAQTDQEAGAAPSVSDDLDMFAELFSGMFAKDDTPIDPVLLAKGERIAQAMVPPGSYRKIMAETFQMVVEPMMAGLDEMPLSVIAGFAGVGEEEINVQDESKLSDLMMIIDPYYKQRNRAILDTITTIMIDLSDQIEPSIRQAMAEAYARRFSADELEAVARFYETEAGAKFAGESLAIYSSPEVMSASMEIMPQFLEKLYAARNEMTEGAGDIPPPRKFEDLSDAEIEKLNDLLGLDRDADANPRSDDDDSMADADETL